MHLLVQTSGTVFQYLNCPFTIALVIFPFLRLHEIFSYWPNYFRRGVTCGSCQYQTPSRPYSQPGTRRGQGSPPHSPTPTEHGGVRALHLILSNTYRTAVGVLNIQQCTVIQGGIHLFLAGSELVFDNFKLSKILANLFLKVFPHTRRMKIF